MNSFKFLIKRQAKPEWGETHEFLLHHLEYITPIPLDMTLPPKRAVYVYLPDKTLVPAQTDYGDDLIYHLTDEEINS